jgi:arginyl-tRNA synthetase
MLFSRQVNLSPLDLAERICGELRKNPYITDLSIANPGFINFKVQPVAWHSVIDDILTKKDRYSRDEEIGRGELLNVEFVSANPTGPLHTGHARNAVFGSVAVKLLEKIGYKVTKEFYINDQGNQIKALAQSVYLRYREVLGVEINESDFAPDMYVGEYVKDIGKNLVRAYQDSFLNKEESEWLEEISEFSVSLMIKNIKKDLKLLDIEMDVYTSEKMIYERKLVENAISILQKKDDIYEGVLQAPKGIIPDEDWEWRYPQTLFKSTKYGDDIERPIKKSDGTWTYFAGDIAYHYDKMNRGYTKMIDILGSDHNGYTKRLKAAVNALSEGKATVDTRLYQLVNFFENGIPVKMSKRHGNFITLQELVDKVGKDITRFMMVSRHHDVMIDFDFQKVVEMSMENPIFYIQYAYARICSVFRHANSIFGEFDKKELLSCDKSSLTDAAEINLIRRLCFWPDNVIKAAKAIEPHRIPYHLHDIAHLFHSLWNRGNVKEELRFLNKNDKKGSFARLSLLESTRIVLEDGLSLIGITPLEEMR